MTGKDFLKIMLCICGYDRNISISTYRGDNNAIGYKISAQNKKGEEYSTENCEGLVPNIQFLINDLQERDASPFLESELLTRFDLPLKDILDDNKREKLINKL